MADFLQTLIAAITFGSLYALVALGYTLVYGVLKFINFAHSDIFVLGAWTTFTASTVIITRAGMTDGAPPWWVGTVAMLAALLVCCSVGYLIERFAYRPLRKAPRLNVLITAIGVSLFLQNLGQLPGATVAEQSGKPQATIPFGSIPRNVPALLPDAVLNESTLAEGTLAAGERRGTIKLDKGVTLEEGRAYRLEYTPTVKGVRARTVSLARIESRAYASGEEIQTQPARSATELNGAPYRLVEGPFVPLRLLDVLIVASSIALMVGLQFLIFGTKLGTAMRAASFNLETAGLMGVNVNRVVSFTFVLGTGLAACAAFLYIQKYPNLQQTAHPVWVLLGLKAFVAAVVGGIGNVRGAVLGGLLIALIEQLGSRYISTQLQDVYVFGVLIVVLLVRPTGILGTPVREKV